MNCKSSLSKQNARPFILISRYRLKLTSKTAILNFFVTITKLAFEKSILYGEARYVQHSLHFIILYAYLPAKLAQFSKITE